MSDNINPVDTENFPAADYEKPLEIVEIAKIQEALKPVGYEIRGYRKKEPNITLRLSPISKFVKVC
jgi:hypothetical protein